MKAPTLDIFIRTYPKDYPWLAYALKSIHQNVTGFRRIIVTTPDASGLAHLTDETLIEVPDLKDGYLGQQLTKLEAWKFTDADFITYWDSDVIAARKFDIWDEFFSKYSGSWTTFTGEDGATTTSVWYGGGACPVSPIIYYTPYDQLSGGVLKWKAITEKVMGCPVDFEYMRRLPLTYHTATIADACSYIEKHHGMTPAQYIESQPYREFSEFNFIGAVAMLDDTKSYDWRRTDKDHLKPNPCRQFWSWGGLDKVQPGELKTPRQQIEEILG